MVKTQNLHTTNLNINSLVENWHNNDTIFNVLFYSDNQNFDYLVQGYITAWQFLHNFGFSNLRLWHKFLFSNDFFGTPVAQKKHDHNKTWKIIWLHDNQKSFH